MARAARRLALDQGNTQWRVAQRDGKTGAGEAATDDDQIKLLHGGEIAVSVRLGARNQPGLPDGLLGRGRRLLLLLRGRCFFGCPDGLLWPPPVLTGAPPCSDGEARLPGASWISSSMISSHCSSVLSRSGTDSNSRRRRRLSLGGGAGGRVTGGFSGF